MDVVIVDDERVSSLLLEHYVRALKWNPVRFAYPHDALAWCASHDAQGLIVDYNMPDMDGIELTRRLRELPEKGTMPVVMVSACSDPLLQQHALRSGINAFLRKPVDRHQFTATMERLLRRGSHSSSAAN